MREKTIERLRAEAMSLPVATSHDFASWTPYPVSADPNLLRVIKDTAFRSKLITNGYAVGIQSPKGPQKCASIILLYPNGDAPAREIKHRAPRRGRSIEASKSRLMFGRAGQNLPTIEDMEKICERVRSLEQTLSVEVVQAADRRVEELQKAIGVASASDISHLYHELGSILEARRNHNGVLRAEVFKRLAADQGFPLRSYLSMLRP